MITARLYLPLLPISQASPLATTVADALSPMLLTYHPPFKGFVLAHKNARCGGPPSDNAGEMGRVTDEYATAFVWITVDTLVFRPNKGAWLTGVVNIQNESHIGLMVWNLFNATVEKKRLPRGWTWRPDTGDEFTQPLNTAGKNPAKRVYKKGDLGAWHDAHGNKVSGELVFRAIDFDIPTEKERDRGLLSIEGSLVSKERDAEIYALENEEEKERQAARTAKRGLF
jgi:DNA-directed RNA polymerase I subunit RPA43